MLKTATLEARMVRSSIVPIDSHRTDIEASVNIGALSLENLPRTDDFQAGIDESGFANGDSQSPNTLEGTGWGDTSHTANGTSGAQSQSSDAATRAPSEARGTMDRDSAVSVSDEDEGNSKGNKNSSDQDEDEDEDEDANEDENENENEIKQSQDAEEA